MIVMPGAWRCERHRLWTNGDCPDCDADLIASHEEPCMCGTDFTCLAQHNA